METRFWVETSESLDFISEHTTWDEAMARIMELETEMREALKYKAGLFCISEVEIDHTIPGGYEYTDRTYVNNGKE